MNEDLLDAFIVEGRELVDQANDALSALQDEPRSAPAMDQLFRACHTLKGSAGLMGFEPMTGLFHAAEDRLSEARSAGEGPDPQLAAALLAVLDQTEAWLTAAEAAGRLPEADSQELVRRLAPSGAAPEPMAPAEHAPAWAAGLAVGRPPGQYSAICYTPREDAYLAGEDPVALMEGVPKLVHLELALRTPVEDLADYDPFACNLVLTGLSAAAPAKARDALKLVADQVEIHPIEVDAAVAGQAAARTLRVESARLDDLAAATDELAIIKNRLAHLAADIGGRLEPDLARELARAQSDLEQRVTRLHGAVGRLRLTPLGPVFRRFPRLVREASATLGKQVELSIEGADVEVDKTVADALFEPLLHLIRNALDHGIEPPDERRGASKPTSGALGIAARAAGGRVVIEVADDGRGIDPARVRAAAVARGVLSQDAAEALTDDAALDLIFMPGFSTAKDVGDLSGRGVGLDAVRAALIALGGEVDATSELGQGARFVLSVPITVRVAKIITVRTGQDTFGVPMESVVETVRVRARDLTQIRAGSAFVWRDQAMPLVDLASLLLLPPPPRQDETKVLIVNAGEGMAAVAVDELGERMEAPLRPLGGLLTNAPGVIGSTLLGDGRVLIVLDLPELIG